jgi:NADPH:quinone reductase
LGAVRAAVLREIGGSLEAAEMPDPVPADGEVLVDVTHASVNPLDIWISRGAPGTAASSLPWIPGTEGAGTVDGQAVLVRGGGLGMVRHGLFATKVAAPIDAVIPLPPGTDPAVAASLGVAGLTAWNCVHTLGACAAQDRVLVLGASGGVGSLAVQLAASTGATVWGQTTNASKATGVEAMGASRVVVSEADGLNAEAAELSPTLVIDGLGGPYTRAAVETLQARGRLVLFGVSAGDEITLPARSFYRKGLSLLGYTGLLEAPDRQTAQFAVLLELVRDGVLRLPVELLPLADADSAFRRILGREVQGKLVLDTRR